MSIRLRELIRNVRACKTQADERACISKECASIRTAFKEESNELRHRNVAKLLFIHMLGYPTHWGQMECLKLIASNKFPEKRIGYLGLMILLDERQEVLVLVENSLKNDLHHQNQYIAGLALCSVGNIASTDICRDLAPEVEKLMSNSNPYVRKKAALTTIRIFRKCPEIMEGYADRMSSLLSDRNHGVLLTGVTLMVEMCLLEAECIPPLRQLVSSLVRILKNLVLSGYAPEYDISGITDPFLQVKILKLLRLVGADDSETSDQMNDILAQVATNTESSKNAGNAILYECVLTIMAIEAESGLRVLAVNILGRFLMNRDNNIRYVALNTLTKVVAADIQAVQRHRNTIVDCLKDSDVSIRRRALELIYCLVNEGNIKVLARELLNYLVATDAEFKDDLTTKICAVVDKYAPDKQWQVDTIIKTLELSGTFTSEEVASNLIALIAKNEELHGYAASKLYIALKEDFTQETLVKAGLWCIGEHGDQVVKMGGTADFPTAVSEQDLANLVVAILKDNFAALATKEYALNALSKLTIRLQGPQVVDMMKKTMEPYRHSINLEIQQRAVEYSNLFNWESIRPGIFENMPVPEKQAPPAQGAVAPSVIPEAATSTPSVQPAQPSEMNLLEDILGGPGPVSTPAMGGVGVNNGSAPTTIASEPADQVDMLMDLLGGGMDRAPAMPMGMHNLSMPGPSPATPDLGLGGLDMMSSPMPVASQPMPAATPGYTAYDKSGFSIVLHCTKKDLSNPSVTHVTAKFNNASAVPVTSLSLQCAVPKYMQLQIMPPSSTVVPANNSGTTTQDMVLTNTQHGQQAVKLRLKIDFQVNGAPISDMATISDLPGA